MTGDATRALCQPAQPKCTWTLRKKRFRRAFAGKMHVMWKSALKMPQTSRNTLTKHWPLHLPQVTKTASGALLSSCARQKYTFVLSNTVAKSNVRVFELLQFHTKEIAEQKDFIEFSRQKDLTAKKPHSKGFTAKRSHSKAVSYSSCIKEASRR